MNLFPGAENEKRKIPAGISKTAVLVDRDNVLHVDFRDGFCLDFQDIKMGFALSV